MENNQTAVVTEEAQSSAVVDTSQQQQSNETPSDANAQTGGEANRGETGKAKPSGRSVPIERFQQVYARALKAERMLNGSKDGKPAISAPEPNRLTDEEKEKINQKFQDSPAEAIHEMLTTREQQNEQGRRIREADAWVASQPEFKTDENYESMMGFIIKENKFYRLDPVRAVQLAYREYKDILADISKETEKAVEGKKEGLDNKATSGNNGGGTNMAQQKENEKQALSATRGGGGGNSSGSNGKTFTRAQIEAMSASEYKENRDAIKKAMREGNIKD